MDGGGWVGTLVEGCTGLCVDLRGGFPLGVLMNFEGEDHCYDVCV